MNHKLVLPGLLLVCLSCVLLAQAAKYHSDSAKLSADEAVALMRMINTAEAEASISSKSYVPLKQLLEARQFKGHQVLSQMTDDVAGLTKDYSLSIIASADGKHYQAKLVPTNGCGVSFFTSDPGIIYQAQALGCNEK
jgi:hypothetical protein